MGKTKQEMKTMTTAAQPMAEQQHTGLVVGGDPNKLPDYIKTGGNRGNENVRQDDLIVPRIELVQALSPCLDDKNEQAYIPNARQGMLFNSLTRRLYGASVAVVPVLFNKQWLVWRDRKKGGGFRGAHNSEALALEAIKALRDKDGKPEEGWAPQDTGQHLVLIARADGVIEEAMISMSRTKLKISRQWNSLVRQAGGDRFSRAYELTGVQERNSAGELFYNFGVRPLGYPNQTMYQAAAEFYQRVASGAVNVVMDVSDVDTDTPAGTEY